MSEKSWQQQLPMVATYSRVVFTPIIIYILYIEQTWSGWVAAVIFIVASMTDWLDGYWARKFNAETTMGKLMDPVTDKILVLGALSMLLYHQQVDPIMVFLLLARDIFIGGIRSVAAANNVIIAAKPFGKWKAALQMLAIPCIFVAIPLGPINSSTLGYYMLWVSVGLSLISATQYTYGYYKGHGTPGH